MPSLGTVVTVIFLGYIGHSMFTMYQLYYPPPCTGNSRHCLEPSWTKESRYSLVILSSERPGFSRSSYDVLVHETNVNIAEALTKHVNVTIPFKTLQNGTLSVAVLLRENFGSRKPTVEEIIEDQYTVFAKSKLTRYAIPKPEQVSLVAGQAHVEQRTKDEKPITHFIPKLNVHIMSDLFRIDTANLFAEVTPFIKLDNKRKYLPIVYINEAAVMTKDLVFVNASSGTREVSVEMQVDPMTMGRLRLLVVINKALQNMHQFGMSESDTDSVKGIFFDTNIFLLLATVLVSALHLLFDIMAIKNDVNFWRGRDSVEGLSLRAVLWRGFSQIIILLYLFDEDTSRIVLFTSAMSTGIELWKVTKAFKMSVHFEGVVPRVRFGKATEAELRSNEFDGEGMRLLSYILYPLCIGYPIYSLIYDTHRSWYSWCIHSLANGVYAFGFLFMLPQLFLNYKLKSVAHLPWRVFMYKAFNTFIDDLFAFIIVMPTAHRVACFRDDIVFVIYLYQRWLYPVDKSRPNEFSGSGEQQETKKTK